MNHALYTGQFGFFVIDAADNPGAYDQEIFLSLREWDPYLSTMGDEDGFLEAAYKYASINGHSLGTGEPIRVKTGQRVLLRILNASATEQRRIALAGHTFEVTALDGNKLPAPRVSPFPAVFQDVSLVVDADIAAQTVEQAVRDGAGELLEDVRLFDVYTGPQLGESRKSLTFALRFRAADRTLTEDEASAARDAAVRCAAERVGAELRT